MLLWFMLSYHMSLSILTILIYMFLPIILLFVLFWLLMIQHLMLLGDTMWVGCKPFWKQTDTHSMGSDPTGPGSREESVSPILQGIPTSGEHADVIKEPVHSWSGGRQAGIKKKYKISNVKARRRGNRARSYLSNPSVLSELIFLSSFAVRCGD